MSPNEQSRCTKEIWKTVAVHGESAGEHDARIAKKYGLSPTTIPAKRAWVKMDAQRAIASSGAEDAANNLSQAQLQEFAVCVLYKGGNFEKASQSLGNLAQKLGIEKKQLEEAIAVVAAKLEGKKTDSSRTKRSTRKRNAPTGLEITIPKVIDAVSTQLLQSEYKLTRQRDLQAVIDTSTMILQVLDSVTLPVEKLETKDVLLSLYRKTKNGGLSTTDEVGKVLKLSKHDSDLLCSMLIADNILVISTDEGGY